MKKLLVVGGTGFIGYHIIKEAKKRKWKITSISLRDPRKKRFHKNVKYLKADMSNFKNLKTKLTENYDFVVNSGGYGKHPDFDKSGEKLFNSHYQGILNIIRALKNKKIKKFVQIGSSAEYGLAKSPQNENLKCYPKTPYALAKFSCTNFLQNLNQINNFPVTILRLFLVYGPKQDKNRILPQVIENCLDNKNFFTTKGNGEIINIGFGKPIRIKNVINLTKKMIGKGKPLFGKLKYKKNTNMSLYPSIKKAKTIIGWTPRVNFIKGLKITIDSYKNEL